MLDYFKDWKIETPKDTISDEEYDDESPSKVSSPEKEQEGMSPTSPPNLDVKFNMDSMFLQA